MKKFWKALALVGCALLLVVASVAGTYAILTSETATVSNTFTAGNVSITLDETKVDEYGEAGDPATKVTSGNQYKLIPNHNYKKDPTIHVAANSEDCYLFVKVENGISAIEAGTTIAAQLTANGWKALGDETNVYYYSSIVPSDDDITDVPVFAEFTIAANADVEDYTDAKINITAYAAQADGFIDNNNFADGALAAWDAAEFS